MYSYVSYTAQKQREIMLIKAEVTIKNTTWSSITYVDAYVKKYGFIAIQESLRTGIPASIKLSQAFLESDFGRSPLSREAYNHFGLKCHSTWKGETYYAKDDDFKNKKLIKSCFRKYQSAKESFLAHSNFLCKNKRYTSLFTSSSYVDWADGLQKAKYATSPTYAKDLKRIIKKYNLHYLDELTLF